MRMSRMLMVPAWLATLSLASALAAGNQEAKQAVPAASGPLKISMVIMGGPKTPDSAVEKELEKRYNVDIEPIFMPAWEEKNVKLNLLMSDPKTMPDVIQWQGGLNGGDRKSVV